MEPQKSQIISLSNSSGNSYGVGAFSARETGILHTMHGNLNGQGFLDILCDCLVPSAHLLGYGDNYFLQDDGASCHRVKTRMISEVCSGHRRVPI